MESNIFSTKRFGQLIGKLYLENKSNVRLVMLGLIAVLSGIFALFAMGKKVDNSMLNWLFSAGLFIAGLLVADRSVFQSKDKISSMFMLLSPNSRFEKIVGGVLISSVIFPLFYLALFYAVNVLFSIGLSVAGLTQIDLCYIGVGKGVEIFKSLLIFQSIYLLGSIWFKRMSFIKSTVSIVGFFFIISLISGTTFGYMVSNMKPMNELIQSNFSHNISFFNSNDELGLSLVSWLLPPFFWIVSYFRLSERQL